LLATIQGARHVSAKTPAGALFIAVVLSGIVYNFTEVTFNDNNALGLLLWLIAMCNPAVMLMGQQAAQIASPRQWQAAAPVRNALYASDLTRYPRRPIER
jgi:hypothetical protein